MAARMTHSAAMPPRTAAMAPWKSKTLSPGEIVRNGSEATAMNAGVNGFDVKDGTSITPLTAMITPAPRIHHASVPRDSSRSSPIFLVADSNSAAAPIAAAMGRRPLDAHTHPAAAVARRSRICSLRGVGWNVLEPDLRRPVGLTDLGQPGLQGRDNVIVEQRIRVLIESLQRPGV